MTLVFIFHSAGICVKPHGYKLSNIVLSKMGFGIFCVSVVIFAMGWASNPFKANKITEAGYVRYEAL